MDDHLQQQLARRQMLAVQGYLAFPNSCRLAAPSLAFINRNTNPGVLQATGCFRLPLNLPLMILGRPNAGHAHRDLPSLGRPHPQRLLALQDRKPDPFCHVWQKGLHEGWTILIAVAFTTARLRTALEECSR